jgi:hypothetical protein
LSLMFDLRCKIILVIGKLVNFVGNGLMVHGPSQETLND